MALDAKKYTRIFSTTGNDSDKIDSVKLAHMEAKFNNNDYLEDEDNFETLAPVLFQLQKITEEFDSVRDHVVNDIVGQQGPKGDKGDKGDTGATGARGATGAAGADGTDGVAGTNGKDAGLYTLTKGKTTTEVVFIPASAFIGVNYVAYSQSNGTTTSNSRGSLHAMWSGIDGKTVDLVHVHTSSSKAIPGSIAIARTQFGTTTLLTQKAGASDTDIDITDWTCRAGESLSITITPGSTTTKIYGATLTLK